MAYADGGNNATLLNRMDKIEDALGRIADCVCAGVQATTTSAGPSAVARSACCRTSGGASYGDYGGKSYGGYGGSSAYDPCAVSASMPPCPPASYQIPNRTPPSAAGCAVPREPRVPPPPLQDATSKEKYAIIGEIAFQLERRIFNYVFPNQQRFYGYSLRNIETLIAREPDMDERLRQQRRYSRMMNKLRQYGFLPYFHSELSSSLINQYGVLGRSLTEVRCAIMRNGFDDEPYLRTIIKTKVPCSLQQDVNIVLDCLVSLSQEDGDPIFSCLLNRYYGKKVSKWQETTNTENFV